MEKKKKTEIQTSCDTCAYLIYDEEYEEYVCDVSMDEDEIARQVHFWGYPFIRMCLIP